MATDAAIYHASFELDQSGMWIVEIEELPEVHSYGRTLGKAKEHVCDALALWLGIPVTEARERIQFGSPDLPASAGESVDRAIAEREIADSASRVAAELMAAAAVSLLDDAHLSMRDAAEILGLSHQRIQQISSSRRSSSDVTPVPQIGTDLAQSPMQESRSLSGPGARMSSASFAAASRRFADSMSETDRHRTSSGRALIELIGFAEEVARHQPRLDIEPLRFPPLIRVEKRER